MTPIKEYQANDFTDFEFEDDYENRCVVCQNPTESNDILCYSCRQEYDELALLWRRTSEGIREKFKEELI